MDLSREPAAFAVQGQGQGDIPYPRGSHRWYLKTWSQRKALVVLVDLAKEVELVLEMDY